MRRTYKIDLLIIGFLILPLASFSQVVINEIMSSNINTLFDEDGNSPDWLELFNNSDSTVQMLGYGLSDNPGEPFKWVLPQLALQPQQYLVIFASGKDRGMVVNHWETVIDWGDDWMYRPGTTEPPSDWLNPGFDDSNWDTGATSIGYGDDDDATIVDPVMSIFLRRTFDVVDTNSVVSALLHVDYDDAFVAYLNGFEVARANIGAPGPSPSFDQGADAFVEPFIVHGLPPPAFALDGVRSLLTAGQNLLAVQVHNFKITSSDITIIPFLTIGLDAAPASARGVSPHLDIPRLRPHTNFKIKSSGETLVLTRPDGAKVDAIQTGAIPSDVSFGRQPDGARDWFLFDVPTPGAANLTTPQDTAQAEPPRFSAAAGFYSSNFALRLTQPDGATIFYTLDGAEPTEDALPYSAPIAIDVERTTVVRARAYLAGVRPSAVVTHTFIENRAFDLPVISLSTTPANLWDNDTGIYVMGDDAQNDFPHFGANFWEDWEIPVHMELFEPDGTPGFSQDLGMKIHGGWSRGFPQKSLALFARARYGARQITYRLFPDTQVREFRSLVLRNSGNDWNRSHIRDGMMHTLVRDQNIDLMAFRPAAVYLNGDYWGIHNIREKVNEQYLATHHGVDPDRVNLLEGQGLVLEGENKGYEALLAFLSQNSMRVEANYAQVAELIDIDNFINYVVAQIYFDNRDWPGNNIKFWQDAVTESKWRWILFDTDFGFGIWDATAYRFNTLEFAMATNGPVWPNPPWSTFLLRQLLENESFRQRFINRFADNLNTVFHGDSVNQTIAHFEDLIEDEMFFHRQRWGRSMNKWRNQLGILRNFAQFRPRYVREHIESKFNLAANVKVQVELSPPGQGKIQLNSVLITAATWQGQYFTGVPIRLVAIPAPGHHFAGWSGDVNSQSDRLAVDPEQGIVAIAEFQADSTQTGTIVINEINYNSAPDFDPKDWIELHNNSEMAQDVSSWSLKDDDDSHIFTFPQMTTIAPGSYLVICADTAAFRMHFGGQAARVGDIGFGFGAGVEQVRIFDASGVLVDSVAYDIAPPWPAQANGTGATLALASPNSDNSLPESWAISTAHGTPGLKNDILVNVSGRSPTGQPAEYSLAQNYPNPFNPQTTIIFTLPERSYVTLQVFDLKGREVARLADGHLAAGEHRVVWQADSKLAAGIYFSRLQATGGFTTTARMILLK